MPSVKLRSDLLDKYSIRRLHNGLVNGEFTCHEIAEACLHNRKTYDPLLQAYHQTNDDLFLYQAKRAQLRLKQNQPSILCGIPASLKCMFATDGLPVFAGTFRPLPDHWQKTGTLANRLSEYCSPVSGLTQASELAFSGLGINPHWGTPRNPWDADNHRVPGGSSSGAAISVLCGSALFALGTDTGGSVRVPAAAAGLVGLKISYGRWPTDGIVPLSPRFDSVGLITRTVADSLEAFLALDKKTADSATTDLHTFADFRVCIADDASLESLGDDLTGNFRLTLRELRQAGMKAMPARAPLFRKTSDLIDEGPNTAAIECSAFIKSEIPEWRDHLGPQSESLISKAEKVSARDYLLRLRSFLPLQKLAQTQMQDTDILISPTLAISPPKLSAINTDVAYTQNSGLMLRNTVVANLCGFCAITIPVGLDSLGLPTGLQLMAKNGDEMKLLQFARLLEECLGTGEERLGKAPLIS